MNYYDLPEWAGWLASIREQPDDDHRLALGEALYRLHGPKSEVTT